MLPPHSSSPAAVSEVSEAPGAAIPGPAVSGPEASGPEVSMPDGGSPSCGRSESLQDKASALAAARPPLRAVFMGTPDFAASILERLLDAPHLRVEAVYTQPDRRSGRGQKLVPSPVKKLALDRGLPVLQPLHFKSDPEGDEAFARLERFRPDVLIVAAYGLILPQRVLDVPRCMPINVHASLLPKYRGAAPIQRAIMAGDSVTGVTIMRMEASLDAGPILMQRAVGIDINDTSGALHDELAREGGELLVQALERLSAGRLTAMPQNDALATYAPKISKQEGLVDFSLPAAGLHARIRGLTPKPGAFMLLRRKGQEPLQVQVGPGVFPLGEAMKKAAAACAPGRTEDSGGTGAIIGVADKALLVATGDGCYAFSSLKPAGKAAMDGQAFFNGYLKGATEAYCTGAESEGSTG